MKKFIAILLVVLSLMGCVSTEIEKEYKKINTLCIDGVTYIYIKEIGYNRGYGYMSVKLDTDSKIVPCNETNVMLDNGVTK